MKDHRSKNLRQASTPAPPSLPRYQTANPVQQTPTAEHYDFVELSPMIEGSGPRRTDIERLTKIYRVPSATDLHPRLSSTEKPWPSRGWGIVTNDVLDLLRRARAALVAKGFLVDSDPVNDLGDGKSWCLVCEPTRNLPVGADPLEVAARCQAEVVKGALSPVWDGNTILVPLWDSGCVPGSKPVGRPKSVLVSIRRPLIQTAAASGAKGKDYCMRLSLKTPIEWQKRYGCPKTYPEAWDHQDPAKRKKFRQLISSEKSRFRPAGRDTLQK